jgi:DNA-binding MarR family transcriptional regulator
MAKEGNRDADVLFAIGTMQPTTYREIAQRLGVTSNMVTRCVDRLIERGLVRKEPMKSRTIRLAKKEGTKE